MELVLETGRGTVKTASPHPEPLVTLAQKTRPRGFGGGCRGAGRSPMEVGRPLRKQRVRRTDPQQI